MFAVRARTIRAGLFHPFVLFVCLILGGLTHSFAASAEDLYGGIPAVEYLTGRFSPVKNQYFIQVVKAGIPTEGGWIYLRAEAATALAQLYRDFHAEHPSVPFKVRSGFRSWDDQKAIWEGKWAGRITVAGKRLNEEIKDPRRRSLEILKYSSMPGTSRHHWGTDVDIGELYNAYYQSGPGKILYDWMSRNAARYGFCQPYTAGRSGGYAEEMWHWSYRPLSGTLLFEWNRYYRERISRVLGSAAFLGAAAAVDLAPRYVNDINQHCQPGKN